MTGFTPPFRCLALLAVVLAGAAPTAFAEPAEETKVKPVLFLVADGFNHGEFHTPYTALAAAGYEIVIASPDAGPVECGNHNEPEIEADLALTDVKPDDYFALMIPGGHSPRKLVQHEASMEIVRAFDKQRQPVGAVCHGPWVLLEAGVMRDRPVTALWSLKDERPDYWQQGAFAAYLDQPVVVSDHYLTGRHVADLGTFTPRLLAHYAAAGGHDLPEGEAGVQVVVDESTISGHEKWMLTHGTRPAKLKVTLIGSTDEAKPNAGPVYEHEGPVTDATLAAVGRLAREHHTPEPAPAESPRAVDAAIAIEDGFNEPITLAMKAFLEYRGLEVAVVASEAGPKRSGSGSTLDAVAFDQIDLPADGLLVAPDVVWPEGGIEPAEQPRLKWLVARYDNGARLVAFGRDTYQLARAGPWEDRKFAGSKQALWYYGRTENKFTDAPVHLTTDRFITASGRDAMAEVMKRIETEWLTESN